MTDEEKDLIGCLAAIPAMLITAPISAALYGWTLATLWGWFMGSIFGFRPLSVLQAIAVMLIVSLLTTKRPQSTKEENKKSPLQAIAEGLAFTVIICALSLIEGWIVLRLMA